MVVEHLEDEHYCFFRAEDARHDGEPTFLDDFQVENVIDKVSEHLQILLNESEEFEYFFFRDETHDHVDEHQRR